MDEDEFKKSLKRGGRSASAIKRIMQSLKNYQKFLLENKQGKTLDETSPQDFKDFISYVEINEKALANHVTGNI